MCVCMEVGDIVLKLHVWIPHGKSRHVFLVFPELSHLVKLRPFGKQRDEILNAVSRKVLYLES